MSHLLNFKNWIRLNESMLNEAAEDVTTQVNAWFRKVQKNPDYNMVEIYPTIPFLVYVSGGQAKVSQGYYDVWIKNGATKEAASKAGLDILGIFEGAIQFSSMVKPATKDANGVHAAIQKLIDAKQTSVLTYSPIGTGMPQGQDAEAIKLLSGKKSTYPYYDYKLKKQVQGGVPCTDTTYTGPGKGSLYQLALEVAAKYF
jgi:hypothetical protein